MSSHPKDPPLGDESVEVFPTDPDRPSQANSDPDLVRGTHIPPGDPGTQNPHDHLQRGFRPSVTPTGPSLHCVPLDSEVSGTELSVPVLSLSKAPPKRCVSGLGFLPRQL